MKNLSNTEIYNDILGLKKRFVFIGETPEAQEVPQNTEETIDPTTNESINKNVDDAKEKGDNELSSFDKFMAKLKNIFNKMDDTKSPKQTITDAEDDYFVSNLKKETEKIAEENRDKEIEGKTAEEVLADASQYAKEAGEHTPKNDEEKSIMHQSKMAKFNIEDKIDELIASGQLKEEDGETILSQIEGTTWTKEYLNMLKNVENKISRLKLSPYNQERNLASLIRNINFAKRETNDPEGTRIAQAKVKGMLNDNGVMFASDKIKEENDVEKVETEDK